ncbi:MAG: thioredoxin domain-containing protein [Chloroflexi bacterium]|nr:thioredoxin domain-containing protein [Chloroflexota bacterium]
MANRLRSESSPYLLQHADNPVDWFPWTDEALRLARETDRPIFLSIGYSACHWCHVMAHESFEDERIASILNQHFVSIKVDREERPDLDQIYMAAVQAMAGSGGWPMSVFLTPEGVPFYGGTYFPPVPRYGMPSFTQVLGAVIEAWQSRREDLVASGNSLVVAIRRQGLGNGETVSHDGSLDEATMEAAFHALDRSFDEGHGGWGDAPKFPQPMALEFLLRHYIAAGNPRALTMVTRSLEAMARGGIYDQLGGGFHRYSVDARWLVPHFEKMLYDNAQLARVYVHAWQVTGRDLFRDVAEETLDYVVREMTDAAGGFYSTQDADSEGQEGKFFVWTLDEILDALGAQADRFIAAYNVTRRGNFEGSNRNVLEYVGSGESRPALAAARQRLFGAREHRVRPGRDEKVLTSWNGLMLAAFAEAARVFERADYRRVAQRNADFLLQEVVLEDGRLHRSWKSGAPRLNGYLEDYTHLSEGLLELYQTDFDPRWFRAAQELVQRMLGYYRSSELGFYDTSDDHERLILRPRDLQDNAMPSGNAMACIVLLKLAGLSGDLHYVDVAHPMLVAMQDLAGQHPLAFGQWLQAMAYALSPPVEIAIVGEREAADTQALLSEVRDGYRPFQVVAMGEPQDNAPVVNLLAGRGQIAGQATAYLCRNLACQAPITEPDDLRRQLSDSRS